MQSDLFSCCICSITYDCTLHIPKLIPTCSHTICSDCLTSIIARGKSNSCPLDRVPFPLSCERSEQFPTNLLILQLIDEKFKNEYATCKTHQELKHLICVTDCAILCKECAEDHKGHVIRPIKEVKTEAQVKAKQLQEALEEFNLQENDMNMMVKDTQKTLATSLKRNFDEMRDLLNQKEKELFREIEYSLENEKHDLDRNLALDMNLKNRVEAQISDLNADHMNPRFFRTLAAKAPIFKIRSELENLSKITQEFCDEYEMDIENFSSLISSIVKEFRGNKPIFRELDQHINVKVENPIPLIFTQNNEDNFDDVKKFLEVDIQNNKALIQPRGSLKNTNPEILALPSVSALKQVRQVDLIFDKEHLTPRCFQALKTLWNTLNETSNLVIHFSSLSFCDQELALLCSDLFWVQQNVKSLSIVNSDTIELDIMSMVGPTLNLGNLRSFPNEALSRHKISPLSLEALSAQITAKFSNLVHFVLELGYSSVTDATIIPLLQGAKAFAPNLKIFVLGLNHTKITDKSIDFLSREICLNSLERFGLFLEGCQVTNTGIQTFCGHMKNHVKKVKTIMLNLSQTKLVNKSISTLSKDILAKATILENLEILLDNNSFINDVSLKKFFTYLGKNVCTLKEFRLSLNKTKITDESIEYLVKEALPSMLNLKSFALELENTLVTDESVQELCIKLIGFMKNMEYFLLNIRHTKVTGKSIEVLVNMTDFTLLKNLKGFEIYMDENQENKSVQNRLYEIVYQIALANCSGS